MNPVNSKQANKYTLSLGIVFVKTYHICHGLSLISSSFIKLLTYFGEIQDIIPDIGLFDCKEVGAKEKRVQGVGCLKRRVQGARCKGDGCTPKKSNNTSNMLIVWLLPL